jgi:hypothetical protein
VNYGAQFKQLLVAALNEEKAARAAGGGTQPASAKARPPKHKKCRSYCVAGTNLTLTDKSSMIRLVLLALILTTPAHAERWCNGTLTSNNVCESNVPPIIVRCDYYDNSNSDPRCVGVGDRRPSVERRTTKSTSPR